MRVIYKAPGGKPEIRDIPNTLEELQEEGTSDERKSGNHACMLPMWEG